MGQWQSKRKKLRASNGVKSRYLVRNGALLLEKQMALTQGKPCVAVGFKVFPIEDIERATNNYKANLFPSGGPLTSVYRGILEGCDVAIRAPCESNSDDSIHYFLNEIAMSQVMTHKNMMRLYGCCLETPLPILVYQFIPHSRLSEHLHGNVASRTGGMPWLDRLKVATDVAYALSYMHNALKKPVVHRYVQSHSVLLDESLDAKLVNFGYSISITPGDKSEIWPVEGPPGYIDPEYVETKQVTDKSDVYSFGVLLLELLTGEQPFEVSLKLGMNLVDYFDLAVRRNQMLQVVNDKMKKEATSGQIKRFAKTALRCVTSKGEERPSMVEVVEELWQIQSYRKLAPML